jgi:hypothetical protein
MLDFQQCQEIIAAQYKRGLDKKKLANNTYLRKLDEDTFAITLHQTDVVFIVEHNGETVYRLNSGGYQTVTTKDRLKTFSPARIYQKRGVWYLNEDGYTSDGKNDVLYFDGIEINKQGKVLNKQSAPSDLLDKKKKLDRMINEYIRGFAKDALENGLGAPSAGDCLMCRIYAEGQAQDDCQHIYYHLQAKYFTRTFLLYCLKFHGYSNPSFTWQLITADCEKGRDDSLKRELRHTFGRIKDKLMKFVDLEETIEEQEAVLAV